MQVEPANHADERENIIEEREMKEPNSATTLRRGPTDKTDGIRKNGVNMNNELAQSSV